LERVDKQLLQVLATHGRMRRERAAMLAGYPSSASTTRNSVTRLRGLGYVEGNNSDIGITPLGRNHTEAIEGLPPAGRDLLMYWCNRVDKVDSKILQVLSKRHPKPMRYAELAVAAGYEPEKSTARNSVTRLRGLGLIHGKNTDGITINEDLAT
jgi:DNA-binding IclR family transcriptional regulator